MKLEQAFSPSARDGRKATQECPCGFFGDSTRECHCSPPQIQRYVSKISGPLIDRIDIHIEVPAVKYKELRGASAIEDSATVRERVLRARMRQSARFSGEGEKMLENAITRMGLSARAHDRILKVARTIADLDESASLQTRHLGEAIQYRTLDRTYWA